MYRLIPSFISEQFDRKQLRGDFQATAMFIDIAGFTSMTQELMENGKEGAEVLADVINRVFTPAIGTIYESNGFVSSFAGDAFTAIFPLESTEVVQVLSAAVRVNKLLEECSSQRTKFGEFMLSARIGISCSSVVWGIIPGNKQSTFYFGGQAVSMCTGNKQQASTGEIVFDETVFEKINNIDEVNYIKKNGSFSLLQSAPYKIFRSISHATVPAFQDEFIPSPVTSFMGRGEFRDIVSCFISFDAKNDFTESIAQIIALVHRFGGYFNKIDFTHSGGMILVLFGAPLNPGDLYNRALDFALAVRDMKELTVRIGLTYGTAFAGFVGSKFRGEYTALGSVVNLSARFTQGKKRAVIYLDQSIYRQIFLEYEIQKLKPRKFKGFHRKIPVYRLIKARNTGDSSFFAGDLFGRQVELEMLTKLLQSVENGKFGGVVHIYGNPGIGKSRLVHELVQINDVALLTMQTDTILRKALNPFAYFLKQYFKQAEENSSSGRRDRFRSIYRDVIKRVKASSNSQRNREAAVELNRIESIIGSVIGIFWDESVFSTIEPKDRAVVTQQAIKELFLCLSLIEPVILFVDDIQCIDQASQEVFETLTRGIDNYPLIILACSRFNDDGSLPELKIDMDILHHTITLEELSGDGTRLLAMERLGSGVSDELAIYIQSRAEGNPFFTEQFCLYLKEKGIIRICHGQYDLVEEPAVIPADINMILVSRIDRLTPELREIVQIASVFGRGFELRILTAVVKLLQGVSPQPETLIGHHEIRDLVAQVEDERIWLALSTLNYIFSHSLLRDAAYDMQLRARLRALHRLAGDAIAGINPEDETVFADCAYHYQQAEAWSKAMEFCEKAGDYSYKSVKYDETLVFRQKALSICREIKGDKHPDTANFCNETGRVLLDMGNYDSALEYYEEALSVRTEVLGRKHQDTAKSCNCVGSIHWYKGQYEMALNCYSEALAIRQELLGENHSDTAESYNDIGSVHSKLGEYTSALLFFEKALLIRRELLGEEHLDTAESYNSIGMAYRSKGEYDNALAFYERALFIRKELLGENHPLTAMSYHNIGYVYSERGDVDIALEYLEKALAICQVTIGEKHPHTANTYDTIGGVYWEKHLYDEALTNQNYALSIRRELLGETHPDTARSYHNIGTSHVRMGNYHKALTFIEKAFTVWRNLLGKKHPDVVTSYNNIGVIYQRMGDDVTAMQYFEEALSTRREILGVKHPMVAMSLGNVASVHLSRENYSDAELLLNESLNSLIDTCGEKHPYTINILKQMAELHEKTGNAEKAQIIHEKLKTISRG